MNKKVVSLLVGLAVVFAGISLTPMVLMVSMMAAVNASCDTGAAGSLGLVDAVDPDNGSARGTRQLSTLNDTQLKNAAAIVAVGKKHKIGVYGHVIALATALQESRLQNLNGGDRDSLGLFQQRPSTGWGTRAQITDTVKAAAAFYGVATHTQNPGLKEIGGWQKMDVTVAAQKVQRSAFPDAYAKWEPLARALLASDQLPGIDTTAIAASTSSDLCGNDAALDCPPSGDSAEKGLTADAKRVLRCVKSNVGDFTFLGVGQRPAAAGSDHGTGKALDVLIGQWDTPAGAAAGQEVADYAVANHSRLGVKYVIWDARIWSVQRSKEGWRRYRNPTGATDSNSMHKNHVHISVYGNAAGTGGSSGEVSRAGWTIPIAKDKYRLTSGFGYRSGVVGGGNREMHGGVDMAAPAGTPIYSAAAGQVTYAGRCSCGFGNYMIVEVGNVEVYYAHQQDGGFKASRGQQVKAGQRIGTVGSTGRSSGSHLHFEIRSNGSATSPLPFLRKFGVNA